MMKVVIAGPRTVHDFELLVETINQSGYDITEVVSGTARGVDTMGEKWATAHNIPVKRMYPDWNQFGNSAGVIRNKQMAVYADAAVVLWDGESRGTRNMIENMIRLKKPYFVGRTHRTLDDFI